MNENNPNLLQVTRVEHHCWKSCPCRECEEERTRRDCSSLTKLVDSHLRSMSVDTAYHLGYIPTRCPEGSLARRLSVESPPPK